ncbi:germ cell nuclear acidic protein-like [Anomaloglossus baeobatrachus]|uniref:germ cell nuclear acidic protein-like n=1 Tax=Anomaloglossus baeobatrachus TaxID=238106 RepID=UPI003F50913A
MSRNKRFKRVIVLSDTEDSCDEVDFHQSRPRKKPIPRSADQDTNTGFNSGPTLDIPDRISTPDPDSNTCSDAVITISDDEDSNIGGIPPCDDNFPCDGEESYAAQHRTPLCNIPGCFLEDIISPNSIYVTDFEVTREELVERLFLHYNSTVFGYQLPKNMAFMWNKSLKTTAGECLQGMKDNQRMSVILLSNRVLDSAERLRSTVAHEMCHAACWIIDGEAFDNHGPLWQAYAKRVNDIHPELPEVTRCHNYTIHYNYYYQCNLCDHKIGRYQKIADAKSYCSRCGGRLRQLSSSETRSLLGIVVGHHYALH